MVGLAGHYKVHTQSQANLQQTLIVEVLNKQNELLEKILVELELIHRLLENLNIVETKVKKTVTSRAITALTQIAREEEEEEGSSLPSFLKGNPWVKILSRRTD
jgi:hypothetical protein